MSVILRGRENAQRERKRGKGKEGCDVCGVPKLWLIMLPRILHSRQRTRQSGPRSRTPRFPPSKWNHQKATETSQLQQRKNERRKYDVPLTGSGYDSNDTRNQTSKTKNERSERAQSLERDRESKNPKSALAPNSSKDRQCLSLLFHMHTFPICLLFSSHFMHAIPGHPFNIKCIYTHMGLYFLGIFPSQSTMVLLLLLL